MSYHMRRGRGLGDVFDVLLGLEPPPIFNISPIFGPAASPPDNFQLSLPPVDNAPVVFDQNILNEIDFNPVLPNAPPPLFPFVAPPGPQIDFNPVIAPPLVSNVPPLVNVSTPAPLPNAPPPFTPVPAPPADLSPVLIQNAPPLIDTSTPALPANAPPIFAPPAAPPVDLATLIQNAPPLIDISTPALPANAPPIFAPFTPLPSSVGPSDAAIVTSSNGISPAVQTQNQVPQFFAPSFVSAPDAPSGGGGGGGNTDVGTGSAPSSTPSGGTPPASPAGSAGNQFNPWFSEGGYLVTSIAAPPLVPPPAPPVASGSTLADFLRATTFGVPNWAIAAGLGALAIFSQGGKRGSR